MKETTGTSSPASQKPPQGKAEARSKGKHGGSRPGTGGKRDRSGRKTKAERVKTLGVSDTLEAHMIEDVEVIISNRATGKQIISKKPALVALLDMLRHEALVNRNVPAAKEYMDRTLGRAKQRVEVSGEIKSEEQRVPSKAALAAAAAYERELAKGA